MKPDPGEGAKAKPQLPVRVLHRVPARRPEMWWVEGSDQQPIAGPFHWQQDARFIAEHLAAPHLYLLAVTGDHYGEPMWPDLVFDDWDAVPPLVRAMHSDGECVLWQLPQGFIAMVLTERLVGDYIRR